MPPHNHQHKGNGPQSERNQHRARQAGILNPGAPKTGIVRAVGISVGRRGGHERQMVIQQAMLAALQLAQAEGVTDPAELRSRMLAARDQVIGGG